MAATAATTTPAGGAAAERAATSRTPATLPTERLPMPMAATAARAQRAARSNSDRIALRKLLRRRAGGASRTGRANPDREEIMSKPLIITLAAASLASALYAHAGGDENNRPENTVASPCITNADGQPGKNNQGPGAGRGGKGGTIVLKGKQPDGCVSANGGDGGNGNRGPDAGGGGDGGKIKF